jgi:purine-nucleoside phosphorylase
MGRFAKVVFGREKLPKNCIVYAGVALPARISFVTRHFDIAERVRGKWVQYTYARKGGKEYFLCFNIYGAAVMLEVLYLLKDGGADKIFFVGSFGGKHLSIGTLVVPEIIIDKAGIVLVDDPKSHQVKVKQKSREKVKSALEETGREYVTGEIASVPSVLYGIENSQKLSGPGESTLGVELELSTFHYFSGKLGLEAFSLVYVNDNAQHDIISGERSLQIARQKALETATDIALKVL